MTRQPDNVSLAEFNRAKAAKCEQAGRKDPKPLNAAERGAAYGTVGVIENLIATAEARLRRREEIDAALQELLFFRVHGAARVESVMGDTVTIACDSSPTLYALARDKARIERGLIAKFAEVRSVHFVVRGADGKR